MALKIVFKQFGDNVSFKDIHIFSTKTIIQLTALLCVYFILDTLRLYYVLKTLEINMNFGFVLKLTLISMFFCNITPFTAGGAIALIYLLRKKGLSLGEAAAATSIKAILASTFFFTVTPVALILNKSNAYNNIAKYIPLLVLLYIVYIYIMIKIIKHNKTIKKIFYSILKYIYKKDKIKYKTFKKVCSSFFKQLDNFTDTFIMFFSGKLSNIIKSFLITMIHFFVVFTFSVVLIYGLNYSISPLKVIVNQIIVNFIMYFGFTPGASGIAEGGYTYIFSKYFKGIELISLTFYWRLFTVYIGAVLGMLLFYHEIYKNIKGRQK